MTLGSQIDELRKRTHRITVYRSGERPEIETWLATHGVPVASRPLPAGGPDPFIELETDGEVVGIIGVDAVEGLLETPISRPGDRTGVSAGYRALFEILENTVFSAMNRRELLAISREIEDRAFRVGDGTLRVSFQTLSTFRSQTAVYRTLATETELDIHVYGIEDWTPPAISGVTYHAEAAQFEPYWALAYDGGSDGTQASGLVAEERAGEYRGFWTNDAARVERIARALETAESASDTAL
jgi:DICT domain-containing protein